MKENNVDTEITQVAMQIILHAGDARTQLEKALGEAEDGNFHKVDQLMEEARDNIILAHNSQTALIQEEARGNHHEFSMLFTHAQDTMMTIQCELRITQHIIKILRRL
ncbi:hypothetical protein HMPREF0981_00083 [Erysipelotrichaceae bacterium 6_1_45]|jgi:PTS system cellobiose-specific IIA component|nr:PTS lactose/cellobiose transporter subunit IIA [[Clostridium] innocuum]EHO32608.1 hypothetical protein HMPREF0981_00083 [Erysipelotrichaceae bacterium 6_1_45]